MKSLDSNIICWNMQQICNAIQYYSEVNDVERVHSQRTVPHKNQYSALQIAVHTGMWLHSIYNTVYVLRVKQCLH